MKILCIGGGPAGLYFALLMKLQNPAHQVTVVERNRPYDTFGWGVVLSDQTLDNLRNADPKSAQLIGDAFNHWDDIEVFFKGKQIRSTGHGFCGIGVAHECFKTCGHRQSGNQHNRHSVSSTKPGDTCAN